MMLSDQLGDELKQAVLDYNWNYRVKICTKCTRQEELKCHKVNNFRIIDGVKIQETHCRKLINARTAKLRHKIKAFFRVMHAETFGMDKAYPKAD